MAQPTVMSCTWIEGGGREGKRDGGEVGENSLWSCSSFNFQVLSLSRVCTCSVNFDPLLRRSKESCSC